MFKGGDFVTIGERIKQRRMELGLTQTELATIMGYKSKVAISNVENNKEDLTVTRVKKYADALSTTPSVLMGWEEEKQKSKLIEAASRLPNEVLQKLFDSEKDNFNEDIIDQLSSIERSVTGNDPYSEFDDYATIPEGMENEINDLIGAYINLPFDKRNWLRGYLGLPPLDSTSENESPPSHSEGIA